MDNKVGAIGGAALGALVGCAGSGEMPEPPEAVELEGNGNKVELFYSDEEVAEAFDVVRSVQTSLWHELYDEDDNSRRTEVECGFDTSSYDAYQDVSERARAEVKRAMGKRGQKVDAFDNRSLKIETDDGTVVCVKSTAVEWSDIEDK